MSAARLTSAKRKATGTAGGKVRKAAGGRATPPPPKAHTLDADALGVIVPFLRELADALERLGETNTKTNH